MNTDKLSLQLLSLTYSYHYFAVVLLHNFSPIRRYPVHVVVSLFIVRVLSIGRLIQGTETSLNKLLFGCARPNLLARVIIFLKMTL